MHSGQMDAGIVESLARYGWSMTSSGITVKLITKAAAPKELTELSADAFNLNVLLVHTEAWKLAH